MSEARALAIAVDALERIRAELARVDVDPLAELRRRCSELEIRIIEGTVDEAGAGRLIGKAPVTLRNWRQREPRIPCQLIGGRSRYRLEDLAAYLEVHL